jgi:hypothetical protein
VRTQWGKKIAAQVLPGLQGKGLCGEEALLVKAFLVTFGAPKVTKAPRQLSGASSHLAE